jgi:hypothetical protein
MVDLAANLRADPSFVIWLSSFRFKAGTRSSSEIRVQQLSVGFFIWWCAIRILTRQRKVLSYLGGVTFELKPGNVTPFSYWHSGISNYDQTNDQ